MIRSCKTQRGSRSKAEEALPLARLNYTYDILKIIGRGSSSTVWLARHM